MKNYTITVNGNVYDVTVEEKNEAGAASAPAAAPKAAPKAPKAPAPEKNAGCRQHPCGSRGGRKSIQNRSFCRSESQKRRAGCHH